MPRGSVVVSTSNEDGFPVGYTPFITEDQFYWLTHRMGLASDHLACTVTNIDVTVIEDWKESPDFMYAYEKCLENKREAFKYLITQLDGKALRVINDLLDDSTARGRTKGVELLMRAQGLLMDRRTRVDADALATLMESLNNTTPVTAITAPRKRHARRR